MKFLLENHSGDVNIDSGPASFSIHSGRNPYSHRVGIRIHITPERLFTCPGIRTASMRDHQTPSEHRSSHSKGRVDSSALRPVRRLRSKLRSAIGGKRLVFRTIRLELPLLPPVAWALTAYLRWERPPAKGTDRLFEEHALRADHQWGDSARH
jgi:hypothetical protein